MLLPTKSISLVTLLLSVHLACGADFWVDGQYGSNQTGDGSAQAPWATIQYAVRQCNGTATIHVAQGTYTEGQYLDLGAAESGDHITIQPVEEHAVTLTSTGGWCCIRVLSSASGGSLSLRGVSIVGGVTSGVVRLDSPDFDLVCDECTITNTSASTGYGIYLSDVTGPTRKLTVTNSQITSYYFAVWVQDVDSASITGGWLASTWQPVVLSGDVREVRVVGADLFSSANYCIVDYLLSSYVDYVEVSDCTIEGVGGIALRTYIRRAVIRNNNVAARPGYGTGICLGLDVSTNAHAFDGGEVVNNTVTSTSTTPGHSLLLGVGADHVEVAYNHCAGGNYTAT